MRKTAAAFLLLALAGIVIAQYRRGSTDGDPRDYADGPPTPMWKNDPGFEKDVFTFTRIRYGTYNRRSSNGIWMGRGRWRTDWPDADLNFSYRLQQMTSIKVDPNGKIIEITDPELFRSPFIYIIEPGDLAFTDEEVPILRRYLLNGGFLMVDDFWGVDEWDNFHAEIKRVFPDRDVFDLPRSHAIFNCVFTIPPDLNLQCPNIGDGTDHQFTGITYESRARYDGDTEAHIRGINDDKGRLCVVICHNTDNGDGWEREGENHYYFREFSEKKAYPLGINIVFYAMTH